ncbi:retrovirus-related pol polyprotein from transposon TNT 1-94 [Tanacetum coccineum]|uniref:Retrovirus-related pol polyprotein from transposon TNT 1-94 n=1 Tax=Tanacetum coccineum TaxID=301880 RepID=A0ABQ4XNE3_9ASTR
MDSVKPRVLSPGRYAIDVEPIPLRFRNNSEVILDYLKLRRGKCGNPLRDRVNSYINASGSQPRSNTKKNRILPVKSVNKKKVEERPRTNKSSLETTNRINSSIRSKRTNDIVEIRNRTLMEAARTMLIFSKALMFLWAEDIATACYTQNQSLIHTRHNKTPYELVHDKKPDLTFFRVFGALCYPTNDSDDLGKLQPTVDIGIFIKVDVKGEVVFFSQLRWLQQWQQLVPTVAVRPAAKTYLYLILTLGLAHYAMFGFKRDSSVGHGFTRLRRDPTSMVCSSLLESNSGQGLVVACLGSSGQTQLHVEATIRGFPRYCMRKP